MSDVTRVLQSIEAGDVRATGELLPLVYQELRQLAAAHMAHERPGQTLDATALVHEAYLRLVDTKQVQSWQSRGHFFAAAAEAMRRILVNRARDKARLKRGGGWKRLELENVAVVTDATPQQLVALDAALEKLTSENPACAELVKLRFFAGLSHQEAAACLGLPRRTADRTWAFARAWLYRTLSQPDDHSEKS